MNSKTIRAGLCAGVSIAVLAGPALAQEADPQGDTVIVYGQALSIQRAIEQKRDADGILDATVQDDIGRLPDLNIAQAVLRLPGVAVQNDQGEARFPILRGLNATYNRTTIDGFIIASPERGSLGRAVPLDLIPASLVQRIEVQKTITPDRDHNAIGGSINLVTRSAFDEDAPFLLGSAFVGHHENSGDGTTLDEGDRVQPWRANIAGGQRFGPDGQFGIVAGFDQSIRNFEIPQVEVDDADYTEFDAAGNNVGLGNGNGIIVPTNNRIFFYNNVRERIGAVVKAEWMPSPGLRFELAGSYNEYNDSERRDEETYELGASGASSQPAMIREQTPTSGITDTGYAFIGIGRFVLDRDIKAIRGAMEWTPNEDVMVEAGLAYSTAELTNPEVTEGFRTDTSMGARYDTSSFFNFVDPLDPEAFYDLTNYMHVNRGTLDRFAEDEIVEGGLDVTWDNAFAPGFQLKTGALYRSAEKTEGYTFNRYVADPSVTYTLADVADPELADADYQGGYRFENRIDLEASDAFFNSNAFTNTATSVSGSNAEETVLAGYLMGRYENGPWTVIGGARIEKTDWEGGPAGGEIISGDYTDVLPSLSVRYNLTEDLVLRLAGSQTLGRPDINQLTRGESINLDENTISRSNPDLKPRRSTNFDAALEWYIPDGILAAGVFYKDVQDEIFVRTTPGPVEVDGVSYTALTQPENASDAEILGFEAQYQQTYSFLPRPFDGFGLSANLTVLDTEYVVPTSAGGTRTTGFFQQPDLTANLTAFYATEAFEVRVSYNYTDSFLDTLSGDPDHDEYWDGRSQVDLQGRFNVTDRVTLIGEVQNLTNEGRTELTGPDAKYLQEDAVFGRTFWLGVSASL